MCTQTSPLAVASSYADTIVMPLALLFRFKCLPFAQLHRSVASTSIIYRKSQVVHLLLLPLVIE